jgi:hypothetical protein
MRARIQSTLLPSEAERLENYNTHEVQDSDSIQKLAIQYRVSVASIKAANKMFDENVVSYKSLLIPKMRNGQAIGQADRTKMLTVTPSVSWQSFQRQICAAHAVPLQKIDIHCLSKLDENKDALTKNAMWVLLITPEELKKELEHTEDADDSKDFLRLRVTLRKTGEPAKAGDDSKVDESLTFATTTQRKGGFVKSDVVAFDALDEAFEAKQKLAIEHRQKLPTMVVEHPESGTAESCVDRFSRVCCCWSTRKKEVASWQLEPMPKKRGNWVKGNAADEAEAVSLLWTEDHYLQS